MRKYTVEVVELSHAEHRKYVTRLEEDRQHFVSALADSMNQVTRLRSKHLDDGEWETTRQDMKKVMVVMMSMISLLLLRLR